MEQKYSVRQRFEYYSAVVHHLEKSLKYARARYYALKKEIEDPNFQEWDERVSKQVASKLDESIDMGD
jgi:hypothetical protein